MSEIREILHRIDEKTIEHLSEPKRKLIRFLKEVYLGDKTVNSAEEVAND